MIASGEPLVKSESLPIRDEPEGEVGFQYKMNLGRGTLKIDNQRERSRETKLGEAFLNASEEIRFEGENRE